MTKTELEKENKKLKQMIRQLQKEIPSESSSVSGLSDVAYGISSVKSEKGENNLVLVKILFDLEKNTATIDKDSLVEGTLGPLSVKAKRAIIDVLVEKDKEINL